MTEEITVHPIGYVRSVFDEKFGTPRQPGLVPAAEAALILQPPYDEAETLRGLEGFSHVWLVFWFHQNAGRSWSPTVRPPRLGGNARMGVYATRSPFRPNPIGLSVVELSAVIREPGRRGLRLRGHDLVDGTPVLDIKPYLPYSDAPPGARVPCAFAGAPEVQPVRFSEQAEADLGEAPSGLRALITETLALDPRPGYARGESGGTHGVTLQGHNVRWRADSDGIRVLSVSRNG